MWTTVRKVLLICGIVSSLLYVAMNVFVPMPWVGVWERISTALFCCGLCCWL